MAFSILCLFLTVPWVCLHCAIVAFPGHTYLPFMDISFFNPFKPNEGAYPYQIDQSITVLRVVGWYFFFLIFIQILIQHYISK